MGTHYTAVLCQKRHRQAVEAFIADLGAMECFDGWDEGDTLHG